MSGNNGGGAAVVVQSGEREVMYPAFGSGDHIKLTIKMVQEMIAVPTREGNRPSEREAVGFMMMCRARQLNPWEGDAFLLGYETKDGPKFSLITSHQAFLKRAELNPAHDGMQSGVVVKGTDGKVEELEGDIVFEGYTLLGGWATIYRKDLKYPIHKRLDVTKYRKSYGVWADNPAMMIVKCSEADALRTAYPTMLGGLYLREEMERAGLQVDQPSKAEAPKPLFVSSVKPADVPPQGSTPPPETTQAPESEPEKPKRTRKAKDEEHSGSEQQPVADQERLDLIKQIRADRRYWVKGFTAICLSNGIDVVNGANWEEAETAVLQKIKTELSAYVAEQTGNVGKA
jgi:phage recombination protein Bet